MKKNIYIILLTIVAICNACTGVLDTPPTKEPSEDIFWQSEADFQMALKGCYSSLQQQAIALAISVYDCMTDNAFCNEGSYGVLCAGNIQRGQVYPEMEGIVSDLYQQCYKAITRVNIFLSRLNLYKGGDISDELRRQFVGEVTFLRCYCYFLLYFHYGEIPVVTEPLTIETQYQPKNSLTEVYDQIYKDLQMCVSCLPDKTYKESGGKVTKGAAQGLLARLLMFEAYDKNGIADKALVQEAYTALSDIHGYSLDENFANNFRKDDQETCPEIIFSIKYLAPNNYHTIDLLYGLYNQVQPVDDLYEDFEEGDERRDLTIAGKTYTWPGGEEVTFAPSTINRHMLKWVRPIKNASDMWTQSDRSDVDIVLLRWGELVLLKAEAANELGHTTEAVELVNQIRERAGLSSISSSTDQSKLRKIIRHERRVETAFEGIRIYDMKRWRIMNKLDGLVLDGTMPDYKTTYIKEYFYLPLPYSEIEKAGGILVQNPNYK